MTEADCIADTRDSLGESPLWDPVTERLFWVDINRCLIHQLDPRTGKIADWPCKTEPGCLGRADMAVSSQGFGMDFISSAPQPGSSSALLILSPGDLKIG